MNKTPMKEILAAVEIDTPLVVIDDIDDQFFAETHSLRDKHGSAAEHAREEAEVLEADAHEKLQRAREWRRRECKHREMVRRIATVET